MEQNIFFVINTVRRAKTRTQRALAPGGHRFIQRVAGNSVVLGRGKFTMMNEENFNKFRDELQKKQEEGTIEVRVGAPTGPVFNFATNANPSNVSTSEETPSDSVPEPAPIAEEDKTIEDVVEPPKENIPGDTPDFSKMTKADLITYIHDMTGESREKLEKMNKKDLLEIVR
jgi:hypothetical protein